MNWDWDKLQEKRRRQAKNPPPQGGGDGPENPFDGLSPGKYMPKIFKGRFPIWPIFIVLLLIWLASGIFIVNPGEVGVVTQFGKFSREVKDGPHYHLPFPIESALILNTEMVRTIEVGITSETAKRSQSKAEESSMFTGDENIVHMQFSVHYNIENARKFLFNTKDPVVLLAGAAEAAMRDVVGRSKVDSILTIGRNEVQAEALRVLREDILAEYDMGVRVHIVQLLDVQPPTEVEEAFRDVASAREDRERFINQAGAYRNEIVPPAQGNASRIVNAANAYAAQVVRQAEGESQRFLAMVEQFNNAEDITRKRLYLEAMQDVFSSPALEKIILSKDGQGSVLPFLNLDRVSPVRKALPQEQAAPSASMQEPNASFVTPAPQAGRGPSGAGSGIRSGGGSR